MARLEEKYAETGGADDGLRTTLSAQFAEEGVDVEFDGVLTDVQVIGDGLIGETFGQELENLQFAGR